ncbi:MAG: tyrosine-type recombinase/integrase [Candidatus Atribacteria bacterium]|nr:tyrosine-type recombinase/integrase [Candidatus Atribacteria bacterium]
MCPLASNSKINNQLINEFCEYLEYERQYSSHTVENYLRVVQQFSNFLTITNQKSLTEVDTSDIAGFMASLKTVFHLMRVSQLNRLSALKNFYRYLRKKGKIQKNPCDGIGGLKEEKSLPTFFSQSEINRFLDALEDRFRKKPNFLHARDRALFEILYSSGLRVGEVVGLKTNDLNFHQKTLKVRGKGGKERIVPFNQKAHQAIRDYLVFRQPKEPIQELFLNYLQRPLTTRGVRVILNKLFGEIGMVKKASPHTFRHSFASHFLSGGAEMRIVQEALGHSSLSTTQIYTHLNWDNMKKVYEKAHPRSHKKED